MNNFCSSPSRASINRNGGNVENRLNQKSDKAKLIFAQAFGPVMLCFPEWAARVDELFVFFSEKIDSFFAALHGKGGYRSVVRQDEHRQLISSTTADLFKLGQASDILKTPQA
jgi:hypothetical protein